MSRVLLIVSLLLAVMIGFLGAAAQSDAGQQLVMHDSGLVGLSVPSNWYISNDGQALVLAATPDRAANWQGGGEMIWHVYVDEIETIEHEALAAKTFKDHGVTTGDITQDAIDYMGLVGWQFDASAEDVRASLRLFVVPNRNQLIRIIGKASPSQFQDDLLASLVLLPQVAQTPEGWLAELRAPYGWQEQTLSSFIQWIAPENSDFAGMEIWFQTGFRADLVAQGEPAFVMRNLGINYVTQVDENLIYETFIGGQAATAMPFETFTHEGVAIHSDAGANFGVSNLIGRAPLGAWTPAHTQLLNAIAATIRITPPTAENAPIGLQQGYRPPPASGQFVEAGDFNLADYEGELVLLHFWFVDCPYCREEWPYLQAVYDEYAERGFNVIAVNAIDSLDYINTYWSAEELNVPLVQDFGGVIHNTYQVQSFPTTFVISPDGVLAQVARGPLSERSLRNIAERYLD